MDFSQHSYAEILLNQRQYFRIGKTKSLDFRIEQLKKLKRVVLENEHRILEALFQDLRKPKTEAYLSEVGVLCEEIDFTIRHLKKWVQQKAVSTPLSLLPAKAKIYPEPYGIVGIFAPWNYPVQLLLSPAIGAIAAGNCVILKPSDLAANTQRLILELINNHFESSFMYAIGGGVPECEKLLKEKFDYIFFTGSPRVGKIIMQAASHHLTPVCLELGGKSPCIVDADANIKVAARRIVWAKFFNAGQTCVAPDYVYVHKKVRDQFLLAVKERIVECFGLNPQSSPFFARIVSEQHMDRLLSYIEQGQVYCGGESDRKDRYIAPTVFNNMTWDLPLMQEEIFGPLMPVMEFDQISDVIDQINARPKPLALYYFTESTQNQDQLIAETSSGGVCINDCIVHLANPHLPFGGVGNSGMGSYHGEQSFKTLSHAKSVLVKTTQIDNPLRYPPYTDKKLYWLKKLI